MKRLLHFALFLLGMSLFGLGINIMAGALATPAPVEVTAEPIPPFEETTTTTVAPETPLATEVPVELPPTTASKPVARKSVQISATSTVRETTTTTTEVSKTPLEIAQSQVGKTGPYAEGEFWCAKFVSWVAEQAKIESFQPSDSPARLHAIANEQERLTNTPRPGYVVFIGPTNQDTGEIIHVAIIESLEPEQITIIQGNGPPDRSVVTRVAYRLDDPRVIATAPFEEEP
jgi:CHAP domain